MTNEQKLILELIRYEINDIPVDDKLIDSIDGENLEKIYNISQKHDVGYIVGSALHKLKLLSGDIQTAFFNEQITSVYRYEMIVHEIKSISELFEKEKLPYIFLKGAVIRDLYPKPEMRMSCDLDILLNPEDVEKAGKLLEANLSFVYSSQCGHEVNWISPSGVRVELHFTLLERDYKQKDLLDRVWDYASPVTEGGYQHRLTNEFYVFYHIAHISKHFLGGGCGIRQFLDLWFINKAFPYDKPTLKSFLEKAGLVKFADAVTKVSKAWFSTDKTQKLPDGLEDYILGGSFGTFDNKINLEKNKTGKTKLKIFLDRVFVSKQTLEYLYPELKKHSILLPVCAVRRWYRILFKDKLRNQTGMLKAIVNANEVEQNKLKHLMEEIGLNDTAQP